MTARLIASIHSAGKPTESRHLGVWNPEWTRSGDERMRALSRSVDEMQRAMEGHHKRALERGDPEDWRTKVRAPGDKFSRSVTAVRDGLRLSRKHLAPAIKALEDAHDSAGALHPYTPLKARPMPSPGHPFAPAWCRWTTSSAANICARPR